MAWTAYHSVIHRKSKAPDIAPAFPPSTSLVQPLSRRHDLQDRTRVHLAPVQRPEHHAEEKGAAGHDDGPVHRQCRDVSLCGPEGEEDADEAVDKRQDDNGDAGAAEAERAVVHLGGRRGEAFV